MRVRTPDMAFEDLDADEMAEAPMQDALSVAREASGDASRSGSLNFDLFHTIVFPNNIRQIRRLRGFRKLLGLSPLVPNIPYVRLSKIERGEVVARVEELLQIARALDSEPVELLIDVADPKFDLARWAAEQSDIAHIDMGDEETAVLLGAALRQQRSKDRSLTPTRMESEYGLTPAIVSRLENGLKPLSRWNAGVQAALARLFEVSDVAALSTLIREKHADGQLAPFLADIRNPEQRRQRTIQAVRSLSESLSKLGSSRPDAGESVDAGVSAGADLPAAGLVPGPGGKSFDISTSAGRRMVPVEGSALADGLVARTPTNEMVEIPSTAGSDAWAMRVCWQSVGPGIPGRAVVIVDPGRFPASGGLAVVREEQGYRLLAVKTDRQGRLHGYSERPERDIPIDTLPPSEVATVVAAIFE